MLQLYKIHELNSGSVFQFIIKWKLTYYATMSYVPSSSGWLCKLCSKLDSS